MFKEILHDISTIFIITFKLLFLPERYTISVWIHPSLLSKLGELRHFFMEIAHKYVSLGTRMLSALFFSLLLIYAIYTVIWKVLL